MVITGSFDRRITLHKCELNLANLKRTSHGLECLKILTVLDWTLEPWQDPQRTSLFEDTRGKQESRRQVERSVFRLLRSRAPREILYDNR